MTIEELKETAETAHLRPGDSELKEILPLFSEMLEFFDIMQKADNDKTSFPGGLPGSEKSSLVVDSKFYRPNGQSGKKDAPLNNGDLIDSAGERDGRFIVVPNVL